MICKDHMKECDGCMKCQEPRVVLRSEEDEPIFEGEPYFDINGFIILPEELGKYRKIAERG